MKKEYREKSEQESKQPVHAPDGQDQGNDKRGQEPGDKNNQITPDEDYKRLEENYDREMFS